MPLITIFCPYPFGEAPSQRFRFEQYVDLLHDKGFKITVLPLLNQSTWATLYNRKSSLRKATIIVFSIIRQSVRVLTRSRADFVFIHREILPFGPPILEWILVKLLQKKIIYDFDDAIWLTDKPNEGGLEKILRWRSKVGAICQLSYKVSTGNPYLATFASQFNNCVIVNPTTIDTDQLHHKSHYSITKSSDLITIGWTGSHSTLKYLYSIKDVLFQLEENHDALQFLVIADKPPELALKSLTFKKWSKETEIKDLLLVDIGLMPLPDDEWTRGKCGFKALQYMALEIPALVSPVGVNSEIVDHEINGFHCRTHDDWIKYLEQLINDSKLRASFGRNGRQKVIDHYSVNSNSANFLSFFE